MNCPQCGAALMPSAKFCGGCGYRLPEAPPPMGAVPGGYAPQPPPPPPSFAPPPPAQPVSPARMASI